MKKEVKVKNVGEASRAITVGEEDDLDVFVLSRGEVTEWVVVDRQRYIDLTQRGSFEIVESRSAEDGDQEDEGDEEEDSIVMSDDETDSDDGDEMHECPVDGCEEEFDSKRGLSNHKRSHDDLENDLD